MYVKSLTLKGFKSFASATHLRLEPGITCIVGPNGSGKSNVVDALAWVMGEQGAKSLRGGKMEDVIFAGTSGPPPLGRAEVALTIDNTDGALPIDYTEVTIARTMFRNGGSEYAINGTPCRLLDVQELLSDSGIGREMHVIVGQGQLDAVLRATPEERRGFIEEAAGVLKHRKRKERALRKLEAMEANLTRVTDLTGEIRRQLGPLGRQAETARKAAVIQAEVRDARLRLLADDLVQLTSTLEQEVADETALIARRTEVEDGLAGLGTRRRRARGGRRGRPPGALPGPGPLVCARPPRPSGSPRPGRWPPSAYACCEDLADEARDAGSGASSRDPEELRRQAAELLREHEALLIEEIAERQPPRSRPPSPSRTEVERATPRSSSASRASPGPSPTAARAWPGWPARSAPRPPHRGREGEIGRMRETVEAARGPRRRGRARVRRARVQRRRRRRRARRTSTRATSRPPPTSTGSEAELDPLQEAERPPSATGSHAAARVRPSS